MSALTLSPNGFTLEEIDRLRSKYIACLEALAINESWTADGVTYKRSDIDKVKGLLSGLAAERRALTGAGAPRILQARVRR